MSRKAKEKWEYGDFQTPFELAKAAIGVLSTLSVKPQTILEPTCGQGAFLLAALETFGDASTVIGVDINANYLVTLRDKLSVINQAHHVRLIENDFFSLDWTALIAQLPHPIFIVGNPPWVTSAELSCLQSQNLPEKSNFYQRRGYEAITGKSNFDISEWMLLQYLDWLAIRSGVIAILCKTTVARKVLFRAWKKDLAISNARIFTIDAKKHFNAAVDACFLVIEMFEKTAVAECHVYADLSTRIPISTIGYLDKLVLSNKNLYQQWRHLKGDGITCHWRSGIKHDCAKAMELKPVGNHCYSNGINEIISIESNYLYPMLKSSDLSSSIIGYGRRYMLVTQRYLGEDTATLKDDAPHTWCYLEAHEDLFLKRTSAVYRKRPPFSIFGVGDYAFTDWKVAISGFYKQLAFKVVGPFDGKPVVFDDTVYFMPCSSKAEAYFFSKLLNSDPARQFFESMIFWTDKRPVTIEILKQLDLHKLSIALNCEKNYLAFASNKLTLVCFKT